MSTHGGISTDPRCLVAGHVCETSHQISEDMLPAAQALLEIDCCARLIGHELDDVNHVVCVNTAVRLLPADHSTTDLVETATRLYADVSSTACTITSVRALPDASSWRAVVMECVGWELVARHSDEALLGRAMALAEILANRLEANLGAVTFAADLESKWAKSPGGIKYERDLLLTTERWAVLLTFEALC